MESSLGGTAPDKAAAASATSAARRKRSSSLSARDVDAYLRECRELTIAEMRRCIPGDTRHAAGLYEVIFDYPLRPAKALRPALCIATCKALGGNTDQALPSAAALELFHNACLVHDDVEDSAEKRRHGPALHVSHGVPVAVNVGDGMLALALSPLRDNVRMLGLGPALRIFEVFTRMARESVEGQMLELGWTRDGRWDLDDGTYLRMVHKKTGWYSFIAPVAMGCIAAGTASDVRARLQRFALCLGVAFQIQDDLLSLEVTAESTGKDTYGDLWEGKYTLPLLHALRTAPERQRKEVLAILKLPRGKTAAVSMEERVERRRLLQKIEARVPDLESGERKLLQRLLAEEARTFLDEDAIARLHEFVTGREGASMAYARAVAHRFARRAAHVLGRSLSAVPDSIHGAFLNGLVGYAIERTH